ncbi:lactonase family protein [Streptomyces sp. SID10853]|uniref:beta-propeller fold lactonase family protein n=1 Tax=Streptomyces sp. SID10853 TaxID=2706028 RepID=UPI0013C13501|nr:lactonase family protein [Streptomyces sp. SID10853]
MVTTGTGRAFIGSFTSAGGPGLVAASVDAAGALSVLGAVDTLPNPSFLAPDPGGSVLYAVSETGEGAAAAFGIEAPLPRLIGALVAVGGADPTHLALAGGHVVTANYSSGSVSVLPVRPSDRGLDAPVSVLRHEGRGPDPERQEGPHAHQVKPDPTGRWVLSVDLGTDSVRVCALDGDTGALTVHAETALRPGSGPRHLVFHPAGTHVYVLNELEPTLTVCRWDAGTGTLEPVGRAALLPGGTVGESFGSGVAVAPGGGFVWAANRGQDSISVLAVDESGEKPVLTATVDCGGRWPRDLVVDPGGRRLYVANEHSGDVTWFDIDPRTGIPSRAGSVEVAAASCVVFA